MPIGRPKGAKAAGVRYEKALAGMLPSFAHGQWWQYQETSGGKWSYCQTDLIGRVGEIAVVLESKYTWTEEAWKQLDRLYIPVVRAALRREVVGIQVCKVLREARGLVTSDLNEAIALAMAGAVPVTLHWAGLSQLSAYSPALPGKPSGDALQRISV